MDLRRKEKGSARKREYILVREIKKEGDEKRRRVEWYTEVRDDNNVEGTLMGNRSG